MESERKGESETSSALYHPLMNVSLPTVQELKTRCSDAESEDLLDAACKLATYRDHCLAEIKSIHETFANDAAWTSDFERTKPEKLELREIDLLRAFIGKQSEFFRTNFFSEQGREGRQKLPVSEEFEESAQHWSKVLDSSVEDVSPLSISTKWQRRWALLLVQNPDIDIDFNVLLSSVFEHIPPGWSKFYSQGLFTVSEIFEFMRKNLENSIPREEALAIQNFPEVPPAFYDSCGLIPKANDILRESATLVVIGPDEYQRREYVHALTSRHNYFPEFDTLAGLKGEGAGFFFDRCVDQARANRENKNSVRGYLGNIPSGVGGPAWTFDTDDVVFGSIAESSLELFRRQIEVAEPKADRLIVAMDNDEYEALSVAIPGAKDLPKLEISKFDERKLLPYCISYLPCILDKTNCAVPLNLLVGFFHQVYSMNPDRLSLGMLPYLHTYIDPNSENFGLLGTSDFYGMEVILFSLFSDISIAQQRERLWARKLKKLVDEYGEFLSRFIGNASELEKLIHLYLQASKLKHPAPLGLNLHKYFPVIETMNTGKVESAEEGGVRELRKLMDDYQNVVGELPKPTPLQTTLFALRVADAHSWYKHLPIYPKTPLYFFLDPKAGEKEEDRSGEGKWKMVRLNPHFGHWTTEEYRERFGYWNYHMDTGGKVLNPQYLVEKGVSGYLNSRIQGAKGESLLIPPRIFNLGKAYVSAFLHANSTIFHWFYDVQPWFTENGYTEFQPLMEAAPDELSAPLKFLWAVLNTPGWFSENGIAALEDVDCYRDILSEEEFPYKAWNDSEYIQKVASKLDGPESLPEAIIAADVLQNAQSQRKEVLRMSDSERTGSEDVEGLANQLVSERAQQLKGMIAAMNRVLDQLYE